MAVTKFGVTYATVRAHYFPHLAEFSTASNPTASTVTEMIEAAAAVLEGKLSAEGISASSITDSASAAYLWCADTVRLATAIRLLPSMAGQDPDVVKAWRAELEERYKALDESGHIALGSGVSGPSEQSNGPHHHIDKYGIELPDDEDVSTLDTNWLRRSDVL